MHLYSFRQGDRSEYIALYLLSALGLAVTVPRPEDDGIDFYCNLGRKENDKLFFDAPYNVQVKSTSNAEITYGGSGTPNKNKKSKWKEHDVKWLLQQKTPFFIAVVDKNEGKMDLFSTMPRWFVANHNKSPFAVKLIPNQPTAENHIGEGRKVELPSAEQNKIEPSLPAHCEPVTWELPLGQPVLTMSFSDSEDKELIENARTILREYIYLDELNSVFYSSGVHYFQWPLVIRPNKKLIERGVLTGAPTKPDQRTVNLLHFLTPIIATLITTYESANENEAVQKLADLRNLLPNSESLTVALTTIDKAIAKHNKKNKDLSQTQSS